MIPARQMSTAVGQHANQFCSQIPAVYLRMELNTGQRQHQVTNPLDFRVFLVIGPGKDICGPVHPTLFQIILTDFVFVCKVHGKASFPLKKMREKTL